MSSSAYRIIDANFNRAREACRLMEEFCRFVLNSKLLTEQKLGLVMATNYVAGMTDAFALAQHQRLFMSSERTTYL